MRALILKRVAISMGTNIAGVGAAFLFDVVLARGLSTYDFGLARSAMSVVMVVSALMALGSGPAIIRNYASKHDPATASQTGEATLSSRAYRLSAFGLLVLFEAAVVLADVWFPGIVGAFVPTTIAVLLSFVRAFYSVDRAALIAVSRLWMAQLTDRIIMFPIAIVALLALTALNVRPTAELALACYGAGLFVSAALAFVGTRPVHARHAPHTGDFSVRAYRAGVARSLPYMMEDLVVMALRHTAVITLALTDHVEAAGMFVIAGRLADLILLAQASGNIAVAPIFAKAHASGDARAITVASTLVSLFFLVSSVALCGLIVLFEPVLLNIFGANYAPAIPVALAIVIARGTAVLFGAGGQVLLMSGFARQNAGVAAVAVVVMALALIVAIPFDPLWGAAIATIAGVFTQAIGTWFHVVRKTGINLALFMPRTIAALLSRR